MKRNMGLLDRIVRMGLAIIITILCLLHTITGNLAIVLLIIASILLITSLAKFCPIYVPSRISTEKKLKQ